MTAINVLRLPAAIHIVSDGLAVSAEHGTTLTTKTFAMPHLNAAIAARGSGLLPALMAAGLSAASSYADLRRNAASAARNLFASYSPLLAKSDAGLSCEIIVAGWPNDGPDAFALSSADLAVGDAWAVVPIDEMMLAPSTPEIMELVQASFGGLPAHQIAAVDFAVGSMEIQRRLCPEAKVGGFVQLTTINRAMITTRIVHRWPDRLGKETFDSQGREEPSLNPPRGI
jgi:hypothetical protein